MMTMEPHCEALAVFLKSVLEGAATVRVVGDNCRGLHQDDAESYSPPHRSERMSDASLPALSRWGNSCSRLMGPSEGVLRQERHDCLHTPRVEAPKVPRRRSSADSNSEGEWARLRGGLADDDDSSSSSEDDDDFDALSLVEDFMKLDGKYAAISGPLPLTDSRSLQESPKDAKSPPVAPKRQNSLTYSDHMRTSLTTLNISLPDEHQLENVDIQRVHKRRHGITLPLSSMAKELMQGSREEQSDDDNSPMFSASARTKKADSLPCCARRRPSPQLEKLASMRSIDVNSDAPVRVKRRPSPPTKLDDTNKNFYCLAPVRAMRRPSPEEYETFNNLVEALNETHIILEDPQALRKSSSN